MTAATTSWAPRRTPTRGRYFENAKFSARVGYSYRSSFLIGLSGANPYYQDDFARCRCALVKQTIVSVSLDALNLNDPELNTTRVRARPRVLQQWRQFYLNRRAKFEPGRADPQPPPGCGFRCTFALRPSRLLAHIRQDSLPRTSAGPGPVVVRGFHARRSSPTGPGSAAALFAACGSPKARGPQAKGPTPTFGVIPCRATSLLAPGACVSMAVRTCCTPAANRPDKLLCISSTSWPGSVIWDWRRRVKRKRVRVR